MDKMRLCATEWLSCHATASERTSGQETKAGKDNPKATSPPRHHKGSQTVMPEKKEAYREMLKAKRDEWNAEIDALSARAEQAEAELAMRYRQQIEELQAKIKDAEERIETAPDAGEDAWKEMKQDMRSSFQIWKESFANAKTEFEKGFRQGQKK